MAKSKSAKQSIAPQQVSAVKNRETTQRQTQPSTHPAEADQVEATIDASHPRAANALQRLQRDPGLLTTSDILNLQRTVGNRAIARSISQARSAQAPVQRQPAKTNASSGVSNQAGNGSGDGNLAIDPPSVESQQLLASTPKHTIQRTVYADIIKDFDQGDLIYGLSESREETVNMAKAKVTVADPKGVVAQQSAAEVNELSNKFSGIGDINIKDASKIDKKYGTDFGTGEKGYTPTKGVSDQADEFKTWLETDANYKDDFTGVNQVNGVPLTKNTRTWERQKKIAKAAIAYTAKDKKKKIYFILDGINMVDVVNKLQTNTADDPYYEQQHQVHALTGDSRKEITSAELRFIFRNWGDAEFNTGITFWRGGKAVTPPWVERPALWQKYADQRAKVADTAPINIPQFQMPVGTAARINAIRQGVLGNLANKTWVVAVKNAVNLGLMYRKKSGNLKGGFQKFVRGLGTINDLMNQAQALNPANKQIEDQVAQLAQLLINASDPTALMVTKDGLLELVERAAHYLLKAVPENAQRIGITAAAQTGVTGRSKLGTSPTALLMMGAPGAGKSTILNRIVVKPDDWVHVDPDAVKAVLPEYQEGVAKGKKDIASVVHNKSKDIAQDITATAMQNRANFIYDRTGGDLKGYQDLITSLRATDYRIKLVLVHVPVDVAVGRVKAREAKTGRGVPEADVRFVAQQVAPNFDKLAPTTDEAFVYDGEDNDIILWKNGQSDAKKPWKAPKNRKQKVKQVADQLEVPAPYLHELEPDAFKLLEDTITAVTTATDLTTANQELQKLRKPLGPTYYMIRTAIMRKNMNNLDKGLDSLINNPDFIQADPQAGKADNDFEDIPGTVYLDKDIRSKTMFNKYVNAFEGSMGKTKADLKQEAATGRSKEEQLAEYKVLKQRQKWEKKNVNISTYKSMSDPEKFAMNHYTGDYNRFNIPLRTHDKEFSKDQLKLTQNLVSALNKLPPYLAPTYRHDALFPGFDQLNRVGAVTSDPAFVSSTREAQTLKAIAGSGDPEAIIVLDGKSGRFVKPASSFAVENEVLFKPYTRFKVVSRYDALDRRNKTSGPFTFPKDLPADLKSVLTADRCKNSIRVIIKKVEVD